MKSTLTETYLNSITATSDPEGRQRYEIQDAKTEGLVVRVNVRQDGTVGLSFRWRRRGENKLLGRRCSSYNLATARRAAEKKNGDQDPQHLDRIRNPPQTLWTNWEAFREAEIVGHTRPSTLRRYDQVAALWGPLAEVKVNRIRKPDTLSLHARLGESSGHRSANMAIDLMQRVWDFAADLDQVGGRNPCRGVKRYKLGRRERVFNRDEISRFIAALDPEPQVYQAALLVALLTGARSGNVVSMRWDEITENIWTIPAEKAKGKRPIRIHLVGALVRRLKRLPKRGQYVFPPQRSDSETPHLADLRSPFNRVCRRAGIEGATPHCLRRTWATIADGAGVNLDAISDGLSHAAVSTTVRHYIRSEDEVVRDAFDQVAGAILVD